MNIFAALSAFLATTALAIFADEAFNVDFHHALVGIPQASNTFFHRPYPETKSSLIYTLSQQGILGAVNPKDGSLIWRQILSDYDGQRATLRAAHGKDVLVTGFNDSVNTWASGDGRQGWRTSFQNLQVLDVQILEHIPGNTAQDVLALLAGESKITLALLDANSGNVRWLAEELSSDVPLRLAVSTQGAHLISLSKGTLKGQKIKVSPIDLNIGKLGDSTQINSESSTASDILHFDHPSGAIVVWLDAKSSSLRVHVAGQKDASSFAVDGHVTHVHLVAPRDYKAQPHFLIHYQTDVEHWADVFHLESKSATISKIYSLPRLAGQGTFSASAIDGQVYFVRVSQEYTSLASSSSAETLAQFPIKSFGLAGISATETLEPLQAVSDIVARDDGQFAIRSAVLLSSGDWVLIRDGANVWVRYESLASATDAVFVTLQTLDGNYVQDLQLEERVGPISAFLHRITRHLLDSQSFMTFIPQLPRVISVWLENFVTPGAGLEPKYAAFGFGKLVLVRTANARLVAIQHSERGQVLFSVKDEAPQDSLSRIVSSYGNEVETPWKDAVANNSYIQLDGQKDSPSSTDLLYNFNSNEVKGYERTETGVRQLWKFTAASGLDIVSISSRLSHEPVASIGKVLGDRRVLYKYLNPNIVLVTTQDSLRDRLVMYLLDAITGMVLHSAEHLNVDISRHVTSVVSENWFAYSFTRLSGSNLEDYPNGPQLVLTELYESQSPNDRGPFGPGLSNVSAALPSYSIAAHFPYVISSAYVIPEEISAMAVTQTGQGITSRQVLANLAAINDLVAIPRQILDPRRPVGKDPTGAQMAEEGLVRYAPLIDFDPRNSLSHSREVAGVRKIITTPSSMESTSLVFAYGLDIFGSRVAPSFTFDILGASFNKVQLGLTVVVLISGTLGIAPLVKRRQVDQLWTSPS